MHSSVQWFSPSYYALPQPMLRDFCGNFPQKRRLGVVTRGPISRPFDDRSPQKGISLSSGFDI